jgi:hypothetical protein
LSSFLESAALSKAALAGRRRLRLSSFPNHRRGRAFARARELGLVAQLVRARA